MTKLLSAADIALALDYAHDGLGRPMDKKSRDRIEGYWKQPSVRRWNDIHGIGVQGKNGIMTIWQAVIAIDSTFPKTGERTRGGRVIQPWSRIPISDEIRDGNADYLSKERT